ncbi:MAG: beta-galactosidase [Anaerolineae bacterium]|nr:beta-galactosidase [Anaerolineae bacterium]
MLVILAALTACAAVVVAGLLVYAVLSDRQESATTAPAAAVAVFTPIVSIPTLTDAPTIEVTPTVTLAVDLPTWTPELTPTQPITMLLPAATDVSTAAPVATTAVPPSATPAPPTATAVRRPTIKSPDYGMQAFLWWRAEVAQRDLEMIRDAGFRWVKQDFSWREIEGLGKGRFDWSITDRIVEQANKLNLRLIVRLDSEPTWASGQFYPNDNNVIMSPPRNYQDFADFAYAVASRYKGRIAAYQIWNEPNLAREWGGQAPSPVDYTRLLKTGFEAIKRGDEAAYIITAGMAPTTRNDKVAMPDTAFIKQMYAAGASPYFGFLGAHGAGFKAPPEMDPAEVSTNPDYYNKGDVNCPGPACRIYCFRHVEDLRQIMVDNGDQKKKVVVLEFGWTIDTRPDSPYAWHAVTEGQQADYFVRAYQYAKANWQPWIGVMSLIYMPDNDWTENDEQYWWSIAAPNYPQFYPREAYHALKAMDK